MKDRTKRSERASMNDRTNPNERTKNIVQNIGMASEPS